MKLVRYNEAQVPTNITIRISIDPHEKLVQLLLVKSFAKNLAKCGCEFV